jgi:hypothetical protein
MPCRASRSEAIRQSNTAGQPSYISWRKLKKRIAVKGAKIELTEKDVLMTNRNLISIGSRAKKQIPNFSGMPYLAVLNLSHLLTKTYMKMEHELGQEGISSFLPRSKQDIWIIERKKLAESNRIS